jgi:phosphatidylglycerophosphatase A
VSRAVAVMLATFFGCGYFPWGPGTIGSLAGVAIAGLLHFSGGFSRPALLILTLLLLGPAVWAATHTARVVGREDPGLVVVDEVLGQWVTLLGAAIRDWKTLLAAFLLFRLFDIWKPWPIKKFEKLPEGFGIIADDVVAGLYGACFLCLGRAFELY